MKRTMKFEQTQTFLENFIKSNPPPFRDTRYEFSENYEPKLNWSEYIPFSNQHGLYFYLDREENIMLIGKAEKQTLGNRVCCHLGKGVQAQEDMFENHQWVDDSDVEPEIRDLITRGTFYVRCMSIDSEYYVAPLECFSQAYHKCMTKELPALNKRIG